MVNEELIRKKAKYLNNIFIKKNDLKRLPTYLTLKVLNKLFHHYNRLNLEELQNIECIELKEEFFPKKESYDKFRIKYLFSNYFQREKIDNSIKNTNEKEIDYKNHRFFFNIDISQSIINELIDIKNHDRYIENPELLRDTSDFHEEISNLPSLEFFQNKNNKKFQEILKYNELNEKNVETQPLIMPSEQLDINDLYTLFNRENDNYQYVLNPNIILREKFPKNISCERVIKIKFKVLRKIQRKSDLRGLVWASKYKIKCPRCNEDFTLLPHELGQNIKHLCRGNYEPKYQAINRKLSVIPEISQNLFMYECILHEIEENEKGEKKLSMEKNIFIYSENDNIKPGLYIGDIFFTTTYLNLSDNQPKQHNLIYLLGKKKHFQKLYDEFGNEINKDLLILESPEAKDLSKNQLNLNHHTKIIDILYSVRRIIKDHTKYIDIDNRGTLLQIWTIISGLGRNLFNYQKIAINVMGDKSIGKTFTSGMIGMIMDESFGIVENSENMSLPGFQGGINNNKNINGKTESIFEPGIVSKYGLVVLDEAEKMFSERQLNLAIKNFPNRSLNIEKVGGENDIPQNYTPILCSNFYDSYHNQEYLEMIKSVYFNLARKDLTNTFHSNNRLEMNKYIDKCNIFLSLEQTKKKYKNDNLVKAIYYTRKKIENSNIDWRTGGRIESSYRILFDCVVQIKKNKMVRNEERKAQSNIPTTLPEKYIFPTEEFLNQIKTRLLDNREINLYDYEMNSQETLVQLNDLKQDICKFVLDYKNNNIHLHLAGNNVEIDPKIYAVFENVCIIIQLIEDPYSFYLTENVKELIINLVMKCKRGLTQTEYNFENHDFRGDLMQFDYDELDLNIKKTQEEMDNEKLKSALENKPNVNQEKENTFETIYFNENNEVKQRSKTTK